MKREISLRWLLAFLISLVGFSGNIIAAPVIATNTQPVTAIDVVGGQIVFTATFTSASPIFYQWQSVSGGVTNNIPGATNTMLTLTNLQSANSANYQLRASNVTGVAVSAASALVVNPVPAAVNGITTMIAAQTGLGAALTNYVLTWNVANGSLIAGQSPSVVGSGSFSQNGAGMVSVLTDGSAGSLNFWPNVGSSTTEVTCGSGAGQSVTYTLNGSTSGYNLTNITVISGWGDAGRDQQAYTIYYSTVTAPQTFIALTSVNFNPADPAAVQSACRATLIATNGVLASNVAAVKFDFTSPGGENGYSGYSEISLYGSNSVPLPPTITSQPQSLAIYAGGNASFSAAAASSQPLTYQWQFIKNNLTNLIAGATNASLTISNATAASSGAYQLFVTNNLGSARSGIATLNVIVPVTGSYESVVLAYNPFVYWKLDETNNPANGSVVAYDYVNGYNGVYQTAAQNGFNGVAGPSPTAFPGFPTNNAALKTFANVANSFVIASVSNLIATNLTYAMWINPSGPTEGYAGLLMDRGAAGEGLGFGGGVNGSGMHELTYTWNQNTTSGFDSGLYPPANQWSFVAMVISPTQAVLYLINTNGIQAATNAIAHDAEPFGVAWHLGDDGVYGGGVRTFPGSIDGAAVFLTPLNQSQLLNLYYNGVGAAPQAATPLVSPATNLFVGNSVMFSESATGATPFQYQWQTNGVNLLDATNSSLLLTNLALANSGNYRVLVSNHYGSVTSAPVALSVTLDTNPPVILRAFNIGITNIEVDFSKTIAAIDATNLANYAFTNNLTILAAALTANNASVILTTAPITYGITYGLVVNNLHDRALPPNLIAANTRFNFTAALLAPLDIGDPALDSTVITTTNGVTISSVGNLIGGSSDQFGFDYQMLTGDFDISVRLANLGLSDLWAQAGLMARVSSDAGSPFAAALATPGLNGAYFTDRTTTNGAAVTVGNFPVNYPNTWLRLSRVGNVLTGFASYDGTNWTQLGSATIAMPSQIYVGLVTTSHNSNQLTTAQFLNYGTTAAGAVTATIVNPHDNLGPSARTTPIVFSEIMYKPADRADGKNLEFIELYNSNPWFHDISDYQVICADMNYTFPPNTIIPGGGFLVIAAAPNDVKSVYGITNVMGSYTGSLKKAETLQLIDEHGALLLTVPYSNISPWPIAADGEGHSIVLSNPTYGEGDPRAWDISDIVGGSPGQMESFRPSALRNVVINEILPHSENPAVPQFIELYNHSAQSNDISGCILTDDVTTNKFIIPPGTIIPPAGFVSFTQSQFHFTLNGAGGTLYFIQPDGNRVLDAVQFGAQANGISYGRWPDGANDFYTFTTNTPGTNNSAIRIGDIVINELMYDPISGNDDDQYLELYNQGTNTVNLASWQLTSAVTFTFPNISIAPDSYLVVGRNIANLFSKYPNLNSGNTVGNFSGKLAHGGELVVLAQPQTLYGTNTILVAEDQVTYGTGGRWGEWTDGGGSSLELIDPRANHRLAANWAGSDETSKSVWTNIETTGVLDNGANYGSSIDHAQIGPLDVGECLVDNVEVDYNGNNYVSNPDFESGTSGWAFQGCMTRSSLENSGYGGSSHSLHIRASDRVWTGDNSCQVSLSNTGLQSGQTATLRFKARWLHGWPEALLRLNGNWLEAAGALPVPNNLGSPGMANSAYITNAGPAIYNVTHFPALPAANQPAVISAQVSDPNGVTNLTLYYRLDPATTYTAVTMRDDGTGGDAVAHDGVFSASIPGQAANQVAAFYISADDSLNATNRFPTLRPNDNEPVRECVVMFGDTNPGGSFGVYHLWMTQASAARWASLGDLSNEGNDCTFVNGNRVIYNMKGQFAGSPAHQEFDTPYGALCHYKWIFNDDDQFLGATSFNKIHQPGNSAGDDLSQQREQLANSFLRALGVPWLNRRYVAVYVNGHRRGDVMEDTQVPNSDFVKEHFPNDADGWLYKMQPWFEFAPQLSGSAMGVDNVEWCSLNNYTTTGGAKKTARYRYHFEVRRTPDSANNFTNVFNLIDVANTSGTSNYVANLENVADMENWMRVFAANHAAGNWDSFGAQNEQNLYGYIGAEGTKYSLMMWDFNIVFGINGEGYTSWLPGQNLFTVNGNDPGMSAIYNTPVFRRMYWRALQELVNGPLNVANSGPLMDAKYNTFVANGLNVENPSVSIEPWLSQAQSSIASQLAAVNATAFNVNSPAPVTNNFAYLTGQAPVNVSTIWINGSAYPITWTTLTGWAVTVPLPGGTNILNLTGLDHNGQPIAGDSATSTVVNTGTNTVPLTYINYASAGSIYTQNFDALPAPGATSVNADNPVTINGIKYSLANPYCFAQPVTASGNTGGLGLSALAGWYGAGNLISQFGATDGDQTTGGQISFGLLANPASTNRALGLLATSSTGGTAFGVKFINGTSQTLNQMSLQFTGEVWRQSNVPKLVQFYYYVDPSGAAAFPANGTASLSALNINLPTVVGDTGGVAVDGTSLLNQTNLNVQQQVITNWPPGAALWLVWSMPSSTGKAQGLGIDNLIFSATVAPPELTIQISGINLLLNWPGLASQNYQVEYKDDLATPTWTPLGNVVSGATGMTTTTNNFGTSRQRFFRLRLVN